MKKREIFIITIIVFGIFALGVNDIIIPWHIDPNHAGYIIPKTGYLVDLTNFVANLADTTKYEKKTDSTNTTTGYTTLYQNSLKQNTIGNLADTSKYEKTTDSINATHGYTTLYQNSLKQNIILNIADTSKYAKMWGGTKIDSGYIKSGSPDSLVIIIGGERFAMARKQAY